MVSPHKKNVAKRIRATVAYWNLSRGMDGEIDMCNVATNATVHMLIFEYICSQRSSFHVESATGSSKDIQR